MTSHAEIAEQIFNRKFNCAQAVFSTFSSSFSLDEKTALKVAACFGGGLARRGDTCGAVTGALMALGLARSTAEPENKEEMYRLGEEFMRRFEEKHPSLLCRELIGFNLSTPLGRQQAHDSGVTRSVCPAVVRDAADILQTLLEPD